MRDRIRSTIVGVVVQIQRISSRGRPGYTPGRLALGPRSSHPRPARNNRSQPPWPRLASKRIHKHRLSPRLSEHHQPEERVHPLSALCAGSALLSPRTSPCAVQFAPARLATASPFCVARHQCRPCRGSASPFHGRARQIGCTRGAITATGAAEPEQSTTPGQPFPVSGRR